MRHSPTGELRRRALVFAALGDETRLTVLAALSRGEARSISQLTAGSGLTRQAVTKHLRVLEDAGMVRCERAGREALYRYETAEIDNARRYLERVSAQWDNALASLKAFVESGKTDAPAISG